MVRSETDNALFSPKYTIVVMFNSAPAWSFAITRLDVVMRIVSAESLPQ